MKPILLFKIGGRLVEDTTIILKLSQSLVALAKEYAIVIVHGGGLRINQNLKFIEESPKFKDGWRVTTDKGMEIVEMTLSGFINKIWVSSINKENKNNDTLAVGLSGVDAQTFICKAKDGLGRVGEIIQINSKYIETLLKEKYIPIISPVSIDYNYIHYNVNADEAAGLLAEHLNIKHFVIISDVMGVFDQNKRVCHSINKKTKQNLIDSKVIEGGMIPKINAVFKALENGVQQVHICTFKDHKELKAQIKGQGQGTCCTLE